MFRSPRPAARRRTAILVTTALCAGSLGLAAPALADTTDAVIRDLTDQGYQRIEIRRTPSRLYVDAEKPGADLDLVVDRDSGRVLSRDLDDDDDQDDDRTRDRDRDRDDWDDDDDDRDYDDDRDDDEDDDYDEDEDEDEEDDDDDDDDDD